MVFHQNSPKGCKYYMLLLFWYYAQLLIMLMLICSIDSVDGLFSIWLWKKSMCAPLYPHPSCNKVLGGILESACPVSKVKVTVFWNKKTFLHFNLLSVFLCLKTYTWTSTELRMIPIDFGVQGQGHSATTNKNDFRTITSYMYHLYLAKSLHMDFNCMKDDPYWYWGQNVKVLQHKKIVSARLLDLCITYLPENVDMEFNCMKEDPYQFCGQRYWPLCFSISQLKFLYKYSGRQKPFSSEMWYQRTMLPTTVIGHKFTVVVFLYWHSETDVYYYMITCHSIYENECLFSCSHMIMYVYNYRSCSLISSTCMCTIKETVFFCQSSSSQITCCTA